MSADPKPSSRQEAETEKVPVMVYMPPDIYEYCEQKRKDSGLSKSAFIVWIIRQAKRT